MLKFSLLFTASSSSAKTQTEFSKFIFNDQSKVTFLNNFLKEFDYSIYDTNCVRINIDEVLIKIDKLNKRRKTIGNF